MPAALIPPAPRRGRLFRVPGPLRRLRSGRLASLRRPLRFSRLPRRTVRLRLTLLYGGLFLASGTALLAVTYGLVSRRGVSTGGVYRGSAAAAAHGRATTGPSILALKQLQEQARAHALSQRAADLNHLLTQSGLALALMAVLSIALGWIVAGRVLRPLRTMITAVRDLSAASLQERLALDGPDDELKELADTFDGLLARLESAFQAQRQFVANASHELRTPLARQRTLAQVALTDPGATIETLRATHERVLASGVQQERLIEALLTLTRGQAGLDRQEPFDLAILTADVLAARRSDARCRRLEVRRALAPAHAAGNARLAERLAANLIDNALLHNVPGGFVEVRTGIKDGHAVLSVINTGPVVPAADLDRLFQPFQRLGSDRTARGEGLGLGLSIVQAIATAHHASLTAIPRDGGGLRIEVSFPPPPADMSLSVLRVTRSRPPGAQAGLTAGPMIWYALCLWRSCPSARRVVP